MDPYIHALMDDSLNLWMAEDWTARQGDELMPSDDEEELLAAMCRFEQEEIRKQVNKSVEKLLKHRDVIRMKKRDNLSFAYALVWIKAYVDKEPCREPGYRACNLRDRAGVPHRSRGYPEIQKIQDYLGPQGYQIKVFERAGGVLWFCDEKYDDAPKKLCLLKEGEHFHGIRREKRVVGFLALYKDDPDEIRFGELINGSW